jgi:hypothetical protein
MAVVQGRAATPATQAPQGWQVVPAQQERPGAPARAASQVVRAWELRVAAPPAAALARTSPSRRKSVPDFRPDVRRS